MRQWNHEPDPSDGGRWRRRGATACGHCDIQVVRPIAYTPPPPRSSACSLASLACLAPRSSGCAVGVDGSTTSTVSALSDHTGAIATLPFQKLCNGCLVRRKAVRLLGPVATNTRPWREPAGEQRSSRRSAYACTDVEIGDEAPPCRLVEIWRKASDLLVVLTQVPNPSPDVSAAQGLGAGPLVGTSAGWRLGGAEKISHRRRRG